MKINVLIENNNVKPFLSNCLRFNFTFAQFVVDRLKMFEFLHNLIPAQIAGGVLAGGLIVGGMVYVHRRYSRRGPSVDDGGTEPATSVVYFNEQYPSETSSSDSEVEALPAIEHIGDAVGLVEGEDNPEASMTAMAGSIERL
ncbi:hypothetical protein J6590_042688 [Homalodisca vitripennis]|nr:hypothetical protein J6590_042688 [Homalodisca vitripennis]